MLYNPMRILDLTPLEYPKNIAFLSYNVRRLKPKERLKVKCHPRQVEDIKRWCQETGNLLKKEENNLLEIERGRGFHGVCLNEKLSFYLTGAKLHLKELFLGLFNRYPSFLFNFVSIKEGIRGIRTLKELGFQFTTLPSPREIEFYCGFAVGFEELSEAQRAFFALLEDGFGVETLFRRKNRGFEILLKAWEV